MAGKTYTQSELQELWVKAGGDPSKARVAAAVAMAESGGRTHALNTADPSGGSRGLWQINGIHKDSTYDALGNAKAAVRISSNGKNFKPWGAYTNGSYKKFYGKGTDGVIGEAASVSKEEAAKGKGKGKGKGTGAGKNNGGQKDDTNYEKPANSKEEWTDKLEKYAKNPWVILAVFLMLMALLWKR